MDREASRAVAHLLELLLVLLLLELELLLVHLELLLVLLALVGDLALELLELLLVLELDLPLFQRPALSPLSNPSLHPIAGAILRYLKS